MSATPKFTRRHYEELAKVIAETDLFSGYRRMQEGLSEYSPDLQGLSEYSPDLLEGINIYRRLLLQNLRAKFTKDNPRFDEERFLHHINTLELRDL